MTTTKDLGYRTVLVYLDTTDPANQGWAYRATYDDGRQESGEVDCDADATPREAVQAWCEEHLRGDVRVPDRWESTPEGARLGRWS